MVVVLVVVVVVVVVVLVRSIIKAHFVVVVSLVPHSPPVRKAEGLSIPVFSRTSPHEEGGSLVVVVGWDLARGGG